MKIPALVLEWLELKIAREHSEVSEMPAPEFESDRQRCLARAMAFRDVCEKLKELS